ncbi:enoyl-CoA hydratase/isomerase family protein [Aquihabitans sp. McL0605]|uniref:enoyl-CoA hydratase/isomerase family protein n=1 Tax=Aquihabitans sp. McL0605 TaxID=3415671 RepID=UPI003CF06ED1
MALVDTALDAGVLTVTLDDEPRRNALSTDLLIELVDILDAADADPAVRVVVLTNTGSVFCAGANLSEQSSAAGGRTVDMAAVFARFRRSPKPYIGRIAGHCVAGGMGLAAAMDISVAVDSAKFGFTEVRVGVAPAMISVLCLPKLREADARAAFLRGNRFPAAEAARIGLINAAVPAAELDAAVAEIVADLLAGGPEAIAASKRLLAEVPGMPVDDAFAWTQRFSAELFTSDEAKEGMGAFLAKRPAAWVPPTDS